MEKAYHHKILIVDVDDNVGKNFDGMLKKENIEHVVAESGEAALKIIKKSKPGFSVFVAEQNLGGISGTEFLEQAKKISPFSSLFLMADHADTASIVKAVNLGIIQRYIAKPLNEAHLISTLKSGMKSYEFLIDNKRLMHLAKEQNTKLYDLNCELMEASKASEKELHELDEEIKQIEKAIEEISNHPDLQPNRLTAEIKKFVKKEDSATPERINGLFSETIRELYVQFTDLAYRNGFEIPPTTKPEKELKKRKPQNNNL